MRRDELPGYHMLNKCELVDFNTDFLIVDFRNVFGVSIELMLKLAKTQENRIRLMSPYRERLSQSFARFFMRVGLPEDIPPFM